MSSRIQQSQPIQGVTTVALAASCTTTGVKASYVVPAGRQARVTSMRTLNPVAGPTVALQCIVGGVTITLATGITAQSFSDTFYLNAGDTIQANCTVLQAASSIDVVLAAEEYLAI